MEDDALYLIHRQARMSTCALWQRLDGDREEAWGESGLQGSVSRKRHASGITAKVQHASKLTFGRGFTSCALWCSI